jgi:predicted NUDIX family NTP pyrophosphohydrolase
MPKTSAGLLLYKRENNILQVFLVHPGGPFFAKKDAGAWSLPKGEIDEGEDALAAARREFEEETGCRPEGDFLPLSHVTQKSGKIVRAWAVEGDCDAQAIQSNTFTLEWPPKSGRMREFPEVDKAGWFTIKEAKEKINPAQDALLDELETISREARNDTKKGKTHETLH